jgi:hypothetical protein
MLNPSAVQGLRSQLRGELIEPEHAGYDAARKVYNAMIDRYPKLIVRCADVADVIACVRFARDQELLLAIRGEDSPRGGRLHLGRRGSRHPRVRPRLPERDHLDDRRRGTHPGRRHWPPDAEARIVD